MRQWFKRMSYTIDAIDGVIKELVVPFLFTKGVLSSERFDVLPPFLRVSFSQTVHFVVVIRALRCFNGALDSLPPHSKHQRILP